MDKIKNSTPKDIPVSGRVLILGPGAVSIFAARELTKMGYEVILISSSNDIAGNLKIYGAEKYETAAVAPALIEENGDDRLRILPSTEILEFGGYPGNFKIKIQDKEKRDEIVEAGAIILANEPFLKTGFDNWGIKESETVRSLLWLESALSSSEDTFISQDLPLKTVFICGFKHHSTPFSQQRAIKAAVKLAKEKKNEVLFITEHFKVAHLGMERLTRIAREAGVLFVKLSETIPEIKNKDNKITVVYHDETLEEKIKVEPGYLVLEEAYEAPDGNTLLAKRLRVNLDTNGFLQGDNIHNQPIYTNRNGIWAVGSAKGPVSLEEGFEEAKAAVSDIHGLLGQGGWVEAKGRVIFDERRCGECLTCYRLCPHSAISFEARPIFHEPACRACGICAAGCPGDAIQIAHFIDDEIDTQIEDAIIGECEQKKETGFRLIAFCCENSAVEAARIAAFKGFKLSREIKLIRVPCAGRVDLSYLLKAFESGADGVAIFGCHHESCKSVMGNTLAKKRVELIKGALEEAGLEKERLFFGCMAPGMGFEFEKIVTEMENTIRGLGQSPLQKTADK